MDMLDVALRSRTAGEVKDMASSVPVERKNYAGLRSEKYP